MKTEIVDTRYGPMKVFSDDIGCSRLIREYGEYSPGELAVMSLFVGSEDIVIDVGANIGGLTIPLAQRVKKVYAFEPQKEVREVLEENVHLAGLTNVEVIPYGLGYYEGKMYCGVQSSNWGPNSPGSIQLCSEGWDGAEEVEVKRLDAFNLQPALIKIDAEGMEPFILAGATDTIQSCRPHLWMEKFPQQEEICQVLKYRYTTIDLPMYYPQNYRNNPHNYFVGLAHLQTLAIP